MPKILKKPTETKSIGLYKDQIDKILLYTSGGNGKLVEFVRQAIDNELLRLDGLEEGDPFGLNEIGEKSFLIPADVYKELHGIKDTAFTRRKALGKINIVNLGGKRFVEILNKKEASLFAQFLSYKYQFEGQIAQQSSILREYMERQESLETILASIQEEISGIEDSLSDLKSKD